MHGFPQIDCRSGSDSYLPRLPRPRSWLTLLLIPLLLAAGADLSVTFAADFQKARSTFYSGDYEACIELTREEVEKGVWNAFWSQQLMKALIEVGRYEEARDVYEEVSAKFSYSIPLRVSAAKAYRFCGQSDVGNKLLEDIPDLVNAAPWRYSDRENLLAIGKYLLSIGYDARQVLEKFYDRILKSDPKYVEAHLAIAQLALQKADYQEAVRSLELALELRPEDPQIHFLLAKAWEPSDTEKSSMFLSSALDTNPRHVESLLFHASNLIDSERYDESEIVLKEVFKINPHTPRGWALKAAIAHLNGKYQQEGEFRTKALATWNLNPQVDYLAGKTLSKHYRFAEGETYQRRALKMDPDFLPAKFQLAQDLLRIGKDDEGWSIVDQVSAADKYNVVAYNLQTLQSRLEKFETLEAPGLIVRMDSQEAKIYGASVVKLLEEARETLSSKYDFELTEPVTVEIFPQQSDFAIRTFGLPGGAGFLGVCFGSLITANSPASQGESPSNWQSVLWHEFCHVVTLQKTKNKMPRWLSEGISVYEELQREDSWGQRMTPRYKMMILGEDFVPLSKLSSAFLNAESAIHLQFAYFESSLAVRYLVDVHGQERLLRLLDQLGAGDTIQDAFQRLYGDTGVLDEDFQKYAHKLANEFVPHTDFTREGLPQRPSPLDLEQWMKEHPSSYFGQAFIVQRLIEQQQWKEALAQAQKLRELYPDDVDPSGALAMLSRIYRELEDAANERKMLEEMNRYSPDNVPSLIRLTVLCRETEDWSAMADHASKLLAVQPLIATGHEAIVEAAQQLKQPEMALNSLRALKEMDPLDPAGLHFELAQALYDCGDRDGSRMEVLQALEHSPRYRAAQRLLVALQEPAPESGNTEGDETDDLASGKGNAAEDYLYVEPPAIGRPPVPTTEPTTNAGSTSNRTTEPEEPVSETRDSGSQE